MATLQFFGAAQYVTGSKHLLTTNKGTNVLLDCGLIQGRLQGKADINRHFGFKPYDIDYVILSHAHIDHSGLLPRLVREGFNGIIFAHPATISLCEIMLLDSAHIQTEDLKRVNERRKKRGDTILDPLYDTNDVQQTLEKMQPIGYDEHVKIDSELSFHFTDAGHLLGSCAVHIDITQNKHKTKVTFTGDIGKYGDPILRNPQEFRQCDVLICESTYGDRLHPKIADSEAELLTIVTETCVNNLGKLIIPAFSVDRTQELIYTLEKMFNEGLLPNIPIFVDSPLSVRATEVIRKHEECYNEVFIEYMHIDPHPFSFKHLTYITKVEESKKLNAYKGPCIIISASGMAEAGRIKHHILNGIENPNNTILLVGYCTPESLGGQLKAGVTSVRIFGEEKKVNAAVKVLDYYSSHADYEEIFNFLKCQKKDKIQTIYLVHGEIETQVVFKRKLEQNGYKHVIIPKLKESFSIKNY
ncbi:MAG: MBL fold metallo-hydrolase [Bacteroidia bacterium]|jgi:metallo-beta-lactamase family protein|nr:MBL fold metallo-hydrolase [Bacteroidia bacterium]